MSNLNCVCGFNPPLDYNPDCERCQLLREIERLTTALQSADVMANAIDELVNRRGMNSRSIVSDARLQYGDPWQYQFYADVPFKMLAPQGGGG